MKIMDILEYQICIKKEDTTMIQQSSDFLPKLSGKEGDIEVILEEMGQLHSNEASRFDGWNNKGMAMLGSSGLLLSLIPLGMPAVTAPQEFHSFSHFLFWFFMVAIFLVTTGCFFLATWKSLVSIRPLPTCHLNEDDWLLPTCPTGIDLKKELVASKMATYKNNVDIVNKKATKVIYAWRYFFLGCLGQMAFLMMAILGSSWWR